MCVCVCPSLLASTSGHSTPSLLPCLLSFLVFSMWQREDWLRSHTCRPSTTSYWINRAKVPYLEETPTPTFFFSLKKLFIYEIYMNYLYMKECKWREVQRERLKQTPSEPESIPPPRDHDLS